jgi:hypothetical protein
VIAVSRRDHLCAALGARLGLTDPCALDPRLQTDAERSLRDVVSGLPSDAYGRGATSPVLPNQPTPFFLAGVETLCQRLADRVIDPATDPREVGARTWSSARAERTIDELVSEIMALTPKDPRFQRARALLAAHHAAALAKVGATEALRSTFVIACMAPTSISVGL